jgi:hypothetical protein
MGLAPERWWVTALLKLLTDHDFDQDILRGLMRRIPDLDAVTAHEVGLRQAQDPELLDWAAKHGRVVITNDRRTMPAYAADRMAAGQVVTGVVVVSRKMPIRQVIDELEMLVCCCEAQELENLIRHLPM